MIVKVVVCCIFYIYTLFSINYMRKVHISHVGLEPSMTWLQAMRSNWANRGVQLIRVHLYFWQSLRCCWPTTYSQEFSFALFMAVILFFVAAIFYSPYYMCNMCCFVATDISSLWINVINAWCLKSVFQSHELNHTWRYLLTLAPNQLYETIPNPTPDDDTSLWQYI